MKSSQIFLSYSRKDKKWLNHLMIHCAPLKRKHSFTIWTDQNISPGAAWFDEIKTALSNSKVAVFLVTPDFLASTFINEHELTPALKLASTRGMRLLWVPVKESLYEESQLKGYQALIDPLKPLEARRGAKLGQAWKKICKGIFDALESELETLEENNDLPPKRKPLAHLSDLGNFLKKLEMAYLFLKVDQFSHFFSSGDKQDDYLWGWSVCDPRRKAEVAKSQKIEKRAASLVVSSFVLSAFWSVINFERYDIGFRSKMIRTRLAHSLKSRYRKRGSRFGIFGTVIRTPVSTVDPTKIVSAVIPNSRHISAALTMLLRLEDPSHHHMIFGALNYLKNIDGYALFSQNPDGNDQEAWPDCGTCAIVLELLIMLSSKTNFLFDKKFLKKEKMPFTKDNFESWRLEKISEGIKLLDELLIEVAGTNVWLWSYTMDKERFKDWNGKDIPNLDPSLTPINLYHTARILYLIRDVHKTYPEENVFQTVTNNLINITKATGGLLPAECPSDQEKKAHLTNTAFFLNSMIPDELKSINDQHIEILKKGIEGLVSMFDKELKNYLNGKNNLLELRADGFSMLFRLACCLNDFNSISDYLCDTIPELDSLAGNIQQWMKGEEYAKIDDALGAIDLSWFSPIIKDRVEESRQQWFEWYNVPLKEEPNGN